MKHLKLLALTLLIGCTTNPLPITVPKDIPVWEESASIKFYANSETGEIQVVWEEGELDRVDVEDLVVIGLKHYDVEGFYMPKPRKKINTIKL